MYIIIYFFEKKRNKIRKKLKNVKKSTFTRLYAPNS